MAFNLDNYMTAEQRIELFAADHLDMRKESDWEVVEGVVYVKVKLWRTWADPFPWVDGLAGESVDTQFAIEKAETSAYARAITNTGLPKYSTTVEGVKAPRANRAEMEKVMTFKEKLESRQSVQETIEQVEPREPQPVSWGIGDAVNAISKAQPKEPQACEHGHILKQGISKGKGKPYYGYVCKKGVDAHAKWAKQTSNGIWYFEEGYENG